MKTAGIKVFKAQLSSYLREVRAGETVLITDRGQVVAEVRPPGRTGAHLTPEQLRYEKAVASGFLRPATLGATDFRRRWLKFKGARLPQGTAQALLDALRAERSE